MTKLMILRAVSLSLLVNVILSRPDVTDSERDSPLCVNRSNYRKRQWSSSIVVGDYLYIDGGVITYDDANGQSIMSEANSTYSIDVSSSWTNATVAIKQIDKTINDRRINSPNLWPASDTSSFYSYNGYVTHIGNDYLDAPPNRLYKFTSDGTGSGQWSEDDRNYTANSNFANLVRTMDAASACGPDTCYAVGGQRSWNTDIGINDSEIVPAAGIISYNLISRQWFNDSLIGSTFKGPWVEGQLFFTDVAGSEGVLIAIGGVIISSADENSITLSFGYAYIYDIATKIWYQQTTGGDVPPLPVTSKYCTVGVKGDNPVNETYEIFMYYSYHGDNTTSSIFADIWVLSLPSFQWHKAGQPKIGRLGHTCSVAGHKQMIIIGGEYQSDSNSDEWPLGLGVFDLSEMVFKDRYDANAPVYTSPEVVKGWYAKNGSMATDINENIKSLFDRSSAADPNVSFVPTSTAARSSSSSSTSGSISTSGPVNTGAIAGGVVGGVFFLVAISVVAIWTFIRRQPQQQKNNRMPDISQPFNPRPFIPPPIESDSQAICEADSRVMCAESDSGPICEVDGQPIHETEAAVQRYELH